MGRVNSNQFIGVNPQAINAICADLDQDLQVRMGLHPMLSAGLAQHYGCPSELMDASSSLRTAAFFSRLGAGTTSIGAIAVIDTSTLTAKGKGGILIDLTQHPSAVRPRRQGAYGVFSKKHTDLKNPQARTDMGITWYTFLTDPKEQRRVSRSTGLLTVSDDETAGILRLSLDGSVAKLGKLAPPDAQYFAERVSHCPLVTKVLSWHSPGQPAEVVLIPPEQARMEIDEQFEIISSLQLWSTAHPTVKSRPQNPNPKKTSWIEWKWRRFKRMILFKFTSS
jgi:hypothetical protein